MNDLISRQAAIDFIDAGHLVNPNEPRWSDNEVVNFLKSRPSAQPDIIRCRNCKFASGDSRICMKFGHSPIGELDFCAWAERRTDG